MGSAFLVAVGTLVGVWLGSWLTRGHEQRQWRRDRCLEAYTDVLRACAVVAYEADAAYGIAPESSDRAAQSKLLLESVAEMYRVADRASLLGPSDIWEPLRALVRGCGEIAAKATAYPKLSEDEWRKLIGTDYADRSAKFLVDARNDLAVQTN
jgi:hypothetical protein